MIVRSVNLKSRSVTLGQVSEDDLDSALLAAISESNGARVFTTTPTPPYAVGDLWAQGSAGDLLVCTTAEPAGESYAATDWVLATKYTAGGSGGGTVVGTSLTVSDTEPSTPAAGDLWLDTNRLDHVWSGSENASPSRLYRNGVLTATNLLASPRPRAADYSTSSSGMSFADSDGGLLVSSTSQSNPGVTADITPTVPAGDYHVHAVVDVTGSDWNDIALGIWGWLEIYPTAISDGVIDVDVTLTGTQGTHDFELKCPKVGSCLWRRVGIYSAADWTAMQSLGIDHVAGYLLPTVSLNVRGSSQWSTLLRLAVGA